MSVSISQQPEDYTPGYNPQLFVGLSNQVASDNFVYTVEITDLITSDSIQYQIAKDPNDDRCYFDAMPFVENYLKHFMPGNQLGWMKVTDGIRKIRVNIGETYGTTGAEIHYPGTDIDYIVWNGVVDYLEFPNYEQDDYLYYAASGSNLVYLTANIDEYTYENKSSYLYVLTSQPGDVLSVTFETFDHQGASLDTLTTTNPYEASSTYTDKYLCINVGPIALEAGGIWSNQVASYSVSDSVLTGAPPAGTITTRKTFYINCACEYEVYTVHFWAKNGGFETIHFNKRSDTVLRKQETTYQVNPYTRSGGTMSYSRSSPTKKVLGSSRTETLRLCTDWLSEEQIELYEQILDSAYIYLDTESLDFPLLTLNTNSYERFKKANEPLFQLTMDFEYSHKNHRQR
jgi:hypothetical protein